MIIKCNGENKKLNIQCVNENGVLTVVTFDPLMLSYRIQVGNVLYETSGKKPFIKLLKRYSKALGGGTISFETALVRHHYIVQEYGYSMIVSEYSWLHDGFLMLPALIRTGVKLYNNGVIRFYIEAQQETDEYLESITWPQAINFVDADTHAYSFEPINQGAMIFDNLYDTDGVKYVGDCPRPIGSTLANMAMYGRVNGEGLRDGYLAIVDTPVDAALYSSKGYSGAFLTTTMWKASLGKLGYRRSVTYRFYSNLDYNSAAKLYRNYLINTDSFVSIDEKIARTPVAADLIGCPVVNATINYSVADNSDLAGVDTTSVPLFTFDEAASYAEKASKRGVEKLTIQLIGWGECGTAGKNPYPLPVCNAAGGYAGLKALQERLKNCGFKLALADQYRDFYQNCVYYDESKAVVGTDGKVIYSSCNEGGKQAYLRADAAPEFVSRVYDELAANGIVPDYVTAGSFVDTVADESCGSDPLTTVKGMQYRAQVADIFADRKIALMGDTLGGLLLDKVVLLDHIDLAEVGQSIPLFDLVYHDSVFVTHDAQQDVLHGILYARLPSLKITAATADIFSKSAQLLNDIDSLSNLASELYNVEMVSHKFLDLKRRIEQTVFANGTSVTVDFDAKSCVIEKGTQTTSAS